NSWRSCRKKASRSRAAPSRSTARSSGCCRAICAGTTNDGTGGLDFCPPQLLRHVMEAEAFDQSLRKFIRHIPFVPFTVELVSGSSFLVEHPEAIAFNAGVGAFIAPD